MGRRRESSQRRRRRSPLHPANQEGKRHAHLLRHPHRRPYRHYQYHQNLYLLVESETFRNTVTVIIGVGSYQSHQRHPELI